MSRTSAINTPDVTLTQAQQPGRHAPARHLSRRRDDRLYPLITSGRWYVLRQLRRHIAYLAATYLPADRSATLVDLGCGDMPYRPLLEPGVRHYHGVDLPGNERADWHLSPAGVAPLDHGSADVVLSSQVLEHVPDPRNYLAEVRRLLRPGGLVWLSTHGMWRHHPHPTDLWRWTSEGLTRLIESAGFAVVEQRGLLGLAATGVLLVQDGLWHRLPHALRPGWATVMQPLMAAADCLHSRAQRDRDACVFFVVARSEPMGVQR